MPGMEARLCEFDRQNADTCWQGTVQGVTEVRRRNRDSELEGGYLRESMDAGVGPTGALRKNCLARYAVDRRRQCALDGRQRGLDLPAVIRCAIVGQNAFPVWHLARYCSATV